MNQALILASKSPRRRELLTQLGYQFTCVSADIDERYFEAENPTEYVLRLAMTKARVIADISDKNSIVLGSDTCVVVGNEILSKPQNFADSQRMLNLLSERKHQVLTAIAVVNSRQQLSTVVSTDVFFKKLLPHEIKNYWQTGEPQDKAGSYGIQGIAGQFVTKLQGSYSAVVGLPLYETVELLSQFGINNSVNYNMSAREKLL